MSATCFAAMKNVLLFGMITYSCLAMATSVAVAKQDPLLSNWIKWHSQISGMAMSYEMRMSKTPSPGVEYSTVSMGRNGRWSRAFGENHKTGGAVDRYASVTCPDYVAVLQQVNGKEIWSVLSLVTRLQKEFDQTQERSLTIGHLGENTNPFNIAGYFEADFFDYEVSGNKVTFNLKADIQPAEHIQGTKNWKIRKGEITFSDSQPFPKSITMEILHESDIIVEARVQFSYTEAKQALGIDYPATVTETFETISPQQNTTRTTYEFDRIRKWNSEDYEQARISHYGIPEPKLPSIIPSWAWYAMIGLVCLTVGVVIRAVVNKRS